MTHRGHRKRDVEFNPRRKRKKDAFQLSGGNCQLTLLVADA
jgi:hypothetical protein